MLVYTTGDGVNGFTLNPAIGSFYHSHANLKFPKHSAPAPPSIYLGVDMNLTLSGNIVTPIHVHFFSMGHKHLAHLITLTYLQAMEPSMTSTPH